MFYEHNNPYLYRFVQGIVYIGAGPFSEIVTVAGEMGKVIIIRNIIIGSEAIHDCVLSHDICIIVSLYRSCVMPHSTWLVIMMYSILTNSVY